HAKRGTARGRLRLTLRRTHAKQRQNAGRAATLAVIRCGAVQCRIFRGAGDALPGPAFAQARRRRGYVEIRVGQFLLQSVQHRVVEKRPPIRVEFGFDGFTRRLCGLRAVKHIRRVGLRMFEVWADEAARQREAQQYREGRRGDGKFARVHFLPAPSVGLSPRLATVTSVSTESPTLNSVAASWPRSMVIFTGTR